MAIIEMRLEGTDHNVVYLTRREDAEGFLRDHVQEYSDTFPDDPVSLDFETTSLYPWEGEVRLTSITAGQYTGVIDHFTAGTFASLYDDIVGATDKYYVFNAKFELLWFDYALEQREKGIPARCHDIAFLRKSVMGGGPLSLALMCKWDLGIDLNKAQQTSDWSKSSLGRDQLIYAGLDAIYTRDLARMWIAKMEPHHWEGFFVLNEAVRATSEAEQTGLLIDEDYHRFLIKMWTRRRNVAENTIRRFTPENVWPNIRSKKQLSDLIKSSFDSDIVRLWPKTAKTGQLDTSRAVLNQFSYRLRYPVSRWLAAIMVFNRADKYLGTYGEKLLNTQHLAGRVYANFNMAQAVTGRYSSSGACNLQNLPNSPKVRRSFVAPVNSRFVIADYKSIELRVLAIMSGDEQLTQDVIFGDSHAQSALAIYRFDEAQFMEALEKHDPWAVTARRKAKSFSFLLVYGGGPPAAAVALRCSDDEASEFIKRWAAKYPVAYHFRQKMLEKLNMDGFLPCVSGRTIYVPRQDRSTTVAANYPIQGTAADVMYRAMFHTKNALDRLQMDARIAATVHDEIIVECAIDEAEEVQAEVECAMKAGWLDIFPRTSVHRLVESAIGWHWGEKA